MGRRELGLVLRLLGPLLQVVCLILLFRPIERGPSQPVLLGLFVAGFVLVVLGNVLMRPS